MPELVEDVRLDRERAIARRLGREPTSVELHAFDAQWSEHCSYKSSRVHLARLPTQGPDVILGPGEDAGAVRLGAWEGETYAIVVAHESHNHPSQVVPFEGAATGIGGIVRDVLCMGARLIALADPLRFGPLGDPHSRYVAQGVVDGVAAYGNAIGVPTIAGDVFFHEGFADNCLVNVVALGIVKESEIIHSSAPAGSEGWDIVLVGKATDRSGFGGAAFSSLVLDEKDAEANKGAVQVPDPFLKNVIMRASYRAFEIVRELGLTVGFKDLGAGGIMGCTAELAASGGFGACIDLDLCPTSQPNVPPEVIAVGETQERLAWVVPPSFTPRLLQIYNEEFSLPQIARHAQAAVIGRITGETDYVMTHEGEEVMHVPIDFLTGGIAADRAYETLERRPPDETTRRRQAEALAALRVDEELGFRIVGHHDVASRRAIYERFDSVVRGATSIPSGYADAGVIVPIPGSALAVALGLGGNPRYSGLDPHYAAEHAVCEAVRNVVAVGARPIALTDCLNFGNPEDARQMGEFVAAVEGLRVAATELGVPFVSGNVSFYNQTAVGRAIPGSAIVACVGAIDDVANTVTPAFRGPENALYYACASRGPGALGGSVLADLIGLERPPLGPIDYACARSACDFVRAGIAAGAILSAHDVSDGGVFAAVAEMAFATRRGPRLGAALNLHGGGLERDEELGLAFFNEGGGFVFEAGPGFAEFHRIWGSAAVRELGTTTRQFDLRIERGSRPPLRWSVDELYDAWAAPLRSFYESAAG